jgi:large subunit ribosomal protein L7/L12
MGPRRWSPAIVELGDRIAALPVAQAAALLRHLADAYGISPAAITLRNEPPPRPDPPSVIAPPRFDLRLDGHDDARKVGLVRALREFLGLGIRDAVDLIGCAPCLVKEDLDAEQAERTKVALEAAGASVSLVQRPGVSE